MTAYDIAKEVLIEHGFVCAYERHHAYGRGKGQGGAMGMLNDIIGIGVFPVKINRHHEIHAKDGHRAALDRLDVPDKAMLFDMMHEQIERIIARGVKQ